ncbi:MAG: M12 family metallopeptidase, partial [Planctomycetota bacterium]
MHVPSLLCAITLSGAVLAQTPALPPEVQTRRNAGCVLAASYPPHARLLGGQTWVGGVVPFALDPSVSPAMAASLQLAMQEISSRVRVQFVPRTTENDYVMVRDATINSSPIGRQGGMQLLYIANWNATFEVVHACMHVLGFWHEHQRPDRDTYVQVQTANVDPLRAVEFAMVPIGVTYNLPYDFGSVMHFGAGEGSANGQPTLLVLPPNQSQQTSIGQRTQLSAGDREALRRTYGSLVPPLVTAASPGSIPSYQAPPITLTGERFDETTRVLFRSTPVGFQILSPTQLRVTSPQLPAIGPATITVESGAGASQPFVVQVTGIDPPRLEGPPVLNVSVAFPFRVYSNAGRQNLMLAAFNNTPSIAPGIVSLGIGNNFSSYGEVSIGLADASGLWTTSLQGPPGLQSGTSIWLQVVTFDLANFTLPLSTTNVLPV